MKILKYILFATVFAVITVALIIFAINNQTDVTVDYLFGVATTSLWLVVFVALGVGGLLALLATVLLKISLRWHKSKANRKLKQVQQEIKHLKAKSSTA